MFRVAKSCKCKTFGLATVLLDKTGNLIILIKLKLTSFLFPILLLGMASSCTIERDLAKEFLLHKDSLSIMLIPPDYVYKSNLKAYEVENYEVLDEYRKDSALYASSLFLQEIDDTLFIGRYFSALNARLRKFGITTYSDDQLPEFLGLTHPAFQVALVQLELEEDVYPYRAEEIFYDSILFYEDFLLNTVNMNSWFEISKLNDTDAVNNLLYASHYVMDELEGRFANNLFTSEVKFKYNLISMKTEDVYTLAALMGEKYADYIFDYLLNEYIFSNYPDSKRPGTFLHYCLEYNNFTPAGDDRFVFLKD